MVVNRTKRDHDQTKSFIQFQNTLLLFYFSPMKKQFYWQNNPLTHKLKFLEFFKTFLKGFVCQPIQKCSFLFRSKVFIIITHRRLEVQIIRIITKKCNTIITNNMDFCLKF